MLELIQSVNSAVNNFIWGVPAMICIIGVGLLLTIKTKFLPIRLFPDMVKALTANNKNGKDEKSSLSSLQTLIVSTATRVGMGNLTGVVAAISAGGAGAVFWMWITALVTTVIGLTLSYYVGLKPGGTIVLLEVVCFLILALISRYTK